MLPTAPRWTPSFFLATRLGLLAILAVGVAACTKKATPAPVGGSDVSPSKVNLKRNVELAKVEQKILISSIEAVGVLEAEAITNVAAGATGIVDEVLFREGDEVDPAEKKPLIKIDQKRYLTELAIADANEREAAAGASMARDNYRRAMDGGIAMTAESRKQSLEFMNGADAKLTALRAAVEKAKHNLSRSIVMPPYKGHINSRHVAPGAYVDEKFVIATIADLTKIRVVGFVPEIASPLVRRRMVTRQQTLAARTLMFHLANTANGPGTLSNLAARVMHVTGEIPSGYDPEFTLQSMPNRQFRAGIFAMSKIADPTTHMFECKAELDPRTLGLVELAPGYTARIRYPIETTPDAMVVPEESVRATERGFIVFEPVKRTNKDGITEWIAKPRRVELGTRTPGSVEIRAGLSPDQWIVKRGAEALEDGTPLKFSPEQEKLLK